MQTIKDSQAFHVAGFPLLFLWIVAIVASAGYSIWSYQIFQARVRSAKLGRAA